MDTATNSGVVSNGKVCVRDVCFQYNFVVGGGYNPQHESGKTQEHFVPDAPFSVRGCSIHLHNLTSAQIGLDPSV